MVGLAFFIIASLIQAVKFGKVELTRNILGQILSDTQNGNAVNSEYDFLGNRNRVTSSMGANLNLQRDKMGDITQMSQEDWTVNFVRDKTGLETERSMGNLKSSFQRDKMGRITEHRVSVGGDAKRTKSYKWGYNDRLHEILDNKLGLTTFEHDIFGNLASANYGSGIKQLRNPDEVGNLFKTEGRTDRKYDKGGRLLEADGTNYAYDLEGNLSKKTLKDGSIWAYEWNASGMLAKVVRPDSEEVSFEYDALGRRTKKTFKGVSTAWVWDGNTPLHEWTDEENLTTWLFEENSFAPIGKLKAEAKYNIISDYLGTPFEMYDQSGGRVWQGELDSFGAIQNFKGDSKTDCPFRYQGQYEDAETGLYYNRFRYYSPEEGVYLSQDPLRLGGGNPNIYSYVHDVNTQVDPFGLVIVYRALNGGQEASALAGEAISPKDFNATHTIQQHIDDGKLNTQYISTTKKEATAEFYAKANPKRGKMNKSTIIAIDTDKLDPSKVFDMSSGIDPQTGKKLEMPALRYATKDAELLIEGGIPKDAYSVVKKVC
jgi:RHS repeat-associated protein